jgi:hypothetical protein
LFWEAGVSSRRGPTHKIIVSDVDEDGLGEALWSSQTLFQARDIITETVTIYFEHFPIVDR